MPSSGAITVRIILSLGVIMRVEAADHATEHGRAVGANMAGANQPYMHLPIKSFRVGDLSFEGVGELWARLDTELLWIEPGREGVVFYLRDDVIRGILLVNVHDRIEWARGLVREQRATTAAERSALVTAKA